MEIALAGSKQLCRRELKSSEDSIGGILDKDFYRTRTMCSQLSLSLSLSTIAADIERIVKATGDLTF